MQSRERIPWVAAFASATAACASLALAQSPQPPTFSSRADAVTVDVLVTNGREPVTGLGIGNFEIRDNGVVQAIESVSSEPMSLDVTCVLGFATRRGHDQLPDFSRAGAALTAALSERDRIHVVPFGSAIRVGEFTGGLGSDLSPWLEAIPSQRGLQPMRDALFVALARRHEHPGRRLVILFSDGFDSRSWSTREQLLGVARRSDAAVHVVKAAVNLYRGYVNPTFLDDLADLTGGRVIEADDKHISNTIGRLLSDYRSQYVLSFQPPSLVAGWHTLEVRLKGASGLVMARRGYWVE